MKTIKLTDIDVHFLKHECKNEVINAYLSGGIIDEKYSVMTLKLSTGDLKIFEDELMKLLTDTGIGKDGEINAFGKRVDNLFDIFNHFEE